MKRLPNPGPHRRDTIEFNTPNCGPPLASSRSYLSVQLRSSHELPPSTLLASLIADPPAAKDLRSASKIMRRLLTVRRIRAASPSPLATISIRNSRLQHVGLVTIEYSSPTSLQYEVDTDAILLEFVLQGQANHRDGQEWRPIPGNSGIVIGHGQFHQQAVQANYRSLILRLERAALEERLCVLLQRPIRQPLAFARTLDLATAGQSFWHLLRWINDELAQGGSILQHNATIVQTTEKLLLDTLLLTHQSNYSTALAAREPAAIPRHLRAVIAAIQAAPEQTWTLTAMAAHAGVSVRTLCEVFRHFRGSTPMEFVRSVRLSRTREDLKQFGPRASIAVIAKRWGFGHAGRFAAAYTRTFGETPSETLRGNKPHERDASPAICGGFSRSPSFSNFRPRTTERAGVDLGTVQNITLQKATFQVPSATLQKGRT